MSSANRAVRPNHWKLLAALPAVDIPTPIDGGDLVAAGSSDSRYGWIVRNQLELLTICVGFRLHLARS